MTAICVGLKTKKTHELQQKKPPTNMQHGITTQDNQWRWLATLPAGN